VAARVDPELAERLRDPMRTALANQDAVGELSQGVTGNEVATITAPTLIGIGLRDNADFQAIAHRYAREIPGAGLVEFPDAAHLIALESPAELTAALRPFLDEQG
jgi:pimeloyl-ACP methyl ester carboxylesterase